MGWSLEIDRKGHPERPYRITFETVEPRVTTAWLTRDEALTEYIGSILFRAMADVIRLDARFPNGVGLGVGRMARDEEGAKRLLELLESEMKAYGSEEDGAAERFVLDRFHAVLKRLELEF